MTPHMLRPGHVVRARGESWIVHRHLTGDHGSVLEVRGRGPDNRGTRASFLLPFEPIEHLPSPDTPRFVRPSTWRAVARPMLAEATSSYGALRSPVHAALAILPFQLEPTLAVVRGLASRILIADEVGLGKTVQAGLLVCELLARRPDARALVVTPAGLRDQWQTELRERFALESTMLDSTSIARQTGHGPDNPWSVPGIIVTSLDYVKRPEVVRALEALIWDVLVFDEAHALAGRSDRATVASVLARRARTLLLLTATPHSGDDEAFARMVSIGDFSGQSSLLGSSQFPLLGFRRTRQDVGLTSSRRTVSMRVRPTTDESAMHGALTAYVRLVSAQPGAAASGAHLAMTVLMRRARSSAWSLRRSLETRLRLLGTEDRRDVLQMPLPFAPAEDDDEPIAELSWPGLSDRDEERRWLEHVLGLTRLAEPRESKFAALYRLVRRTSEPAIVFTEYRDTLDRLGEHLREHAPVQLHGGLTSSERQHVLSRFVAGDARLLLATDAASEGLNLHHRCRLVINLELPWTPVRLEQRIGRVERIGQTRRVHAVHLLAAGTAEEDSISALAARTRHVAGVVGGMRPGPPGQQIVPQGVLVADLRAAAHAEAERLEQSRALARGVRLVAIDTRPCITAFHRQRTKTANHWVYRLVLEDSESQAIWDTVIGVAEDTNDAPRGRRDLRAWLATLDGLVEPFLALASEALLASLRSELHEPLALALRREQAIASYLEQQRARLASSLLQPGLFDRRAERAAAAHNTTLDEALERCRRRLTELERHRQISYERPRLVVGAIRR